MRSKWVYAPQMPVPTVPTPMPMSDVQARMSASRMTPQAPVSTATGMSMAAIPSYGGVSIQVPNEGSGALHRECSRVFYPPFQPLIVLTTGWEVLLERSTHWLPSRLGEVTIGSAGSPPPGQGGGYPVSMGLLVPYQYDGQGGSYGVPASTGYQTRNYPLIGIPNELRSAVKVIVPFHSDTDTSERAAAFWRFIEKCTNGVDSQMRLTAFEQCLQGKAGQKWWCNSRIDSFDTRRVRFHSDFICQKPAQLWNRLKTAKRNRGKSAEKWRHRISTMCVAIDYNEPRMRFEFFLDGLRNKQMRAMLNSSIPEACALLLYTNLHLPVEEEEEFAGDGTVQASAKGTTSTQAQMLQQMQMMN
ncbi:hypothetical protein PC110_g21424 [Phytophthora cactorum]|uniref:Retrotransposon gag domain-containing protein n=2 Tax=Phytophthora cactorum TaxID=29920 RepID=A0A329RCH5_9STRA|nr:hypothetical protein PC110_g21424 [Phytophthora cactorum]